MTRATVGRGSPWDPYPSGARAGRPQRREPRARRSWLRPVQTRSRLWGNRAVASGPDAEAGGWRDHREVIDAIAFTFQTGTQWVHLPEKYGNWRGVYNRLRMWALDGTWERVFIALMAQADADEA